MPRAAHRLLLVLFVLAPTLLCGTRAAQAARFQAVGGAALSAPAVGAAWGDYDGDGYADVFIGAASGEQLLHNNGDGTFTDVAAAVGLDTAATDAQGCAWGDYDNDGQLDLVVMRLDHPLQLYHNNGGSFTDMAAAAGLALSGRVGAGVAWGDYDADNWLDLFVCYTDETGSALYRNGHDGTFTDVTEAALPANRTSYGVQPAWADSRGWNVLDVMMTRHSGSLHYGSPIFFNAGDGTFGFWMREPADAWGHAGDTSSVAWGDYDNDGMVDEFIGAGAQTDSLLVRNDLLGGADIQDLDEIGMDALYGAMHGAAWGDYDNDGFCDLVVGPFGEVAAAPLLFRNDGDGTFTESAPAEGLSGAALFNAVCWGDFDRDGRLDLLATGNDVSTLYRNTGAVGEGHWLRVRALTSASGDATDGSPVRDALGARVLVNLDNDFGFPPQGRTMMRVIDGGSSYMGQNEPVAQFGLASSTVVAVLVGFADGTIVMQKDVAADQEIELHDVATEGFGAITGTITDAALGDIVQHAFTSVAGLTAHSWTGGDGVYLIPRVPAGSGYTVHANAAAYGYYPTAVPNVTVVAGQTTTVDMTLDHPRASIRGTVREDGTGTPIAGAWVDVGPQSGPAHPSVRARTNADGTYSIAGMFPGTYGVTCDKRGYDLAAVSDVVLPEDQEAVVDFDLTKQIPPDPYMVTDFEETYHGAGADCFHPVITSDGRYVVFSSFSTRLVPEVSEGRKNIFLVDRVEQTVELISRAADGSEADADCSMPSVSADGRFVAFSSPATNLVPGIADGRYTVYVYDRETEQMSLGVLTSEGAVPDGDCYGWLTADGRHLLFSTNAPSLGGAPGEADPCYLRDLHTGSVTRVDIRSDGTGIDDHTFRWDQRGVTPDGRLVAFEAGIPGIVPEDDNDRPDVFVRDLVAETTEWVSYPFYGVMTAGELLGGSGLTAISGDGRCVLFTAYDCALLTSDERWAKILVRDRQAQTSDYISDFFSGARPQAISGDGNVVAYDIRSADPWSTAGAIRVLNRATELTRSWTDSLGNESETEENSGYLSANGQYLVATCTLWGGAKDVWIWEPMVAEFGTLQGQVTAVGSGAPVPHARIWIGSDLFTMADREGRYSIGVAVTPGTTVQVSADGYAPGTRADVAVASGETTQLDFVLEHDFTDLTGDYWAASSIQACAEAGIVSGYADGSYHPTEPVTRAQMAVYLARALAGGDALVPTGPAGATFADVEHTGYGSDGTQPHWAYRYVEYCAAHDVVQGYPEGTYHPDEVVNRGQMAVYMARAHAEPSERPDLPSYAPPSTPTFLDVPGESGVWAWCAKYVEYIAGLEPPVTTGYTDGLYHPEYEVTRDQMAVYVARAFELAM